ncbi:MAG: hypothetical protein K8S56_04430, partial [Candidatus Cloacimonetes bacterium]|nr:hypothetical protein [Candidatus Cloacimonadota bacterium]
LYIVLSKSTVFRGVPVLGNVESVLHLGLGRGRFVGNTETSKQLNGLFAGFEGKISNLITFMAEMDGHNVNAGFGLTVKNLTARVGFYRIEEINRDDISAEPRIALNLKYTFDQFSEIKYKERNQVLPAAPSAGPTSGSRRVISDRQSTDQVGENPLLKELELIRQKRQQAEKELEEIKRTLQE